MPHFVPDPQLLKVIVSFGHAPFKVRELREKIAKDSSSLLDKSSSRQAIYGRCRTLIKNGLLAPHDVSGSKRQRYVATDKLFKLLSGYEQNIEASNSFTDVFENLVKDRVKRREREILLSLGATEELEALKAEYPERARKIDETLVQLKEKNVRTLGKIEGLEMLLAELSPC